VGGKLLLFAATSGWLLLTKTDDPNTNAEDRRRALEYIAREVAMRIFDRFLSGF
jgi:hypothetical protein